MKRCCRRFEGLCRRCLGGVFGRGEGAALIAFGNRVGVGRLGSQHRFGIGLGIVFRLVAEAIRVRIIVPRALIVRDAIDDFVPNIGMFEADAHKLGQIARADPD